MNRQPPDSSARLRRLLWLGGLALLIALWLFPLSTRLTRAGGVMLLGVLWIGLAAGIWKHRFLRAAFLAATGALGCFLLSPARSSPPPEMLRNEYLAALRRYEGVGYYWGGESPKGIDCSGLVRRGLIDSLFLSGIRTLNAGLVRESVTLWWKDQSAHALGQQTNGVTIHVTDVTSLNDLDYASLVPGDLAVTRDGMHVLAFLGGKEWIEADPAEGKVMRLSAPSNSVWFQSPMRIVRWSALK